MTGGISMPAAALGAARLIGKSAIAVALAIAAAGFGLPALPAMAASERMVAIGADGLIFLPYLLGERTPHMDALARGSFVGLGYHHQRGHLARAVMEGVGFALRDALSISLALGAQADAIVVAGGGAESTVWRQILTDILGMPLRKSRQQEQAGIGAAILAGVGCGIYPDIATPVQQFIQYDEPTLPDTAQQARYHALYEQFQTLYPALRASMHTLAQSSKTL